MMLARMWRDQLWGGQPIKQWYENLPTARGLFGATNQVQVLPAWRRGGISVPVAHSQAVSIRGLGQTVFKRML